MKTFTHLLICFFMLIFTCCSNRQSGNTEAMPQKSEQKEVVQSNSETRKDIVVQDEKVIEEYTKVYTMKTKTDSVIGDVYVKFENDSLFRYLYVVNSENDTLYWIKKNIFYLGDGQIDDEGSEDIYGYTFLLKENPYFLISRWDKDGKCAGDDAEIGWDCDMHAVILYKTP